MLNPRHFARPGSPFGCFFAFFAWLSTGGGKHWFGAHRGADDGTQQLRRHTGNSVAVDDKRDKVPGPRWISGVWGIWGVSRRPHTVALVAVADIAVVIYCHHIVTVIHHGHHRHRIVASCRCQDWSPIETN